MGRYTERDAGTDKFWRQELLHLRTKAGLSARELSYATDVSPEQILRFEQGKVGMPIARIERVFAALGYELELISTHPEGEEVDTSWVKELWRSR